MSDWDLIGRISKSGDNFVSISGNCIYTKKTDFHPGERNACALQCVFPLSFSDGDQRNEDSPAFLIR